MNDPGRLKKLYQIEEKRFIERLRRYEETSHTMDTHQFYLEDILLRKEEMFYKYLPSSHEHFEPKEESSIRFDYEFIHRNTRNVGWKKGEDGFVGSSIPSKICKVVKFPIIEPRKEREVVMGEPKPSGREHRVKGTRLYMCEIEGCDKKYTSSFGLKYHMKEGHSQEKMNIFKPFSCPFEGCGKKYKNSNGLKYHIRHYHEDQT